MNTTKTKAIVLRRTNYGETDRIVQLITPVGKMSAMARGARKEKSKLAGGIELFAVCDVVISKGKGELGVLTSSRLVKFYKNIMVDYDRMQFAYSTIKLVSGASEMVDGADWYDILLEVLAGLDANTIPLSLIQTWFYLHYAEVLGHGLSLQYDVDGNRLLSTESYKYDDADRGLRQADGGELKSDHIKFLRLIAIKSIKVLIQVGGVKSILPECLLVARRHAAIKQ